MKRWTRQLGLIMLVTSIHLVGSTIPIPNPIVGDYPGTSLSPVQPAYAQATERRAIASAVYDQLPDFPLENQYVHTETGEMALDNTLIYRLIQYHSGVQSRPLGNRLDWKLTLADYLGVNEWMDEERYPDRFLQSNPFHQDIEVVRALNRQQREDLIQALLVVLGS